MLCLTNAVHEVRRSSAIVGKGNDLEPIGETDKDDVVRERVNGHSPHVAIFYSWNQSADLGEGLDELERPASLSNESLGHTSVSISVPGSRLAVLGLCWLDDMERLQRPSTSLSTRSRTVLQSVLANSPARAAATRFRISLAHASSTSASASCRLSSKSAAIFARSSSGNSNASLSKSRP